MRDHAGLLRLVLVVMSVVTVVLVRQDNIAVVVELLVTVVTIVARSVVVLVYGLKLVEKFFIL